MTNSEKLAKINKFLAAHNRPLLSDYRKARHENLLNEVLAFEAKVEAATDELNAQIAAKADEPDALLIDEKTGEMTRYSELPEDEQLRLAQPVKIEDVAPVSVSTEKLPAYKVLANKSGKKSSLENPVKFIHDWLNENPDVKRKQAVTTLVECGVNYATARTQYQRWFSGRK